MYQGKFYKNRKQAAISAHTDTQARPVPTKGKEVLD